MNGDLPLTNDIPINNNWNNEATANSDGAKILNSVFITPLF